MISFLAPPLHSLHGKIFLLCLAAVFLPGMYFAWKVGQGIDLVLPALLAFSLTSLVAIALSSYVTGILNSVHSV